MQYSNKIHDQYAILSLNEEKLTSTVAPELKSQLVILHSQGKENIIIDLGDVKYADSSGLSALLRTHKLCKNSGGIFVIANPQEHVQKLINISQLNGTLNILPTVNEAIEAVFMHEIKKDVTEDEGTEEGEKGDE